VPPIPPDSVWNSPTGVATGGKSLEQWYIPGQGTGAWPPGRQSRPPAATRRARMPAAGLRGSDAAQGHVPILGTWPLAASPLPGCAAECRSLLT
jgi:hypothetical protein